MDEVASKVAFALQDIDVAMKLSSNETPFSSQVVEVKPSSTHGNGLFAKHDIPAGTRITMYPIHQYAKRIDTNKWEFKTMMEYKDPFDAYGLDLDKNTKIYGCPMFHNALFQGHLANDPVISLDYSDVNKFIIRYLVACKVKANTRYDKQNHLVYLVAVRDIRAGDEILVPYGLGYWFTRFHLDETTEMANLVKYLETQPIEKHKFVVELMESLAKIF